tara:strand:+ start:10815 stop:11552 length:738 start_codon:yes stop_codon:yes gene_type:complete
MIDEIKKQIKNHAIEELPNECCGLLLEKEPTHELKILKCENNSINKKSRFSISAKDYLEASKEGTILAFYHSHNSENDHFSEYDKAQSEGHKLKCIMYCLNKNSFHEYVPNNFKPSYMGKDFELGKNDCFTLIRDFYKNEYDIEIKNYHRDHKWPIENPDYYEANYEAEGFVKIFDGPINDTSKLKRGDLILMKPFGKKNPSHGAIYMDKDLILHHQVNCYSRIENYNNSFKQRTVLTARHKQNL